MKKKRFFKAAAAICLSFALLPFAGCAQMPDAKTLMEKADEEMKKLDSYASTINLVMDMGSESGGKKMEMNIDGTVMMDMILEPSTAHLQTNLKMDVFGQQQEYNMETYQFTQSDQLIAVSNDGSGWTRFEDSSELQNIAGFKDLFDYGLMSDLDPKVTGSDKINDKDVWCVQFTEGMEELLELLNSEELDTASKALLTSMGKSIKINCKVYIDKETNRYVKGVGEITGLNDFLSSLMSGATDADAKLTIDTFEITVDYDKYNDIKDIQIPQDAKDAVLTDSDSEQA